MKETSLHEKDQVQNVKQVQQESQVKFIGGITVKKGMTLWELNRVTGDIQKAKFESLPAQYRAPADKNGNILQRFNNVIKNPTHVAKVIVNENCTYCYALRIESAVKKFGLKVKIVKGKNQKAP